MFIFGLILILILILVRFFIILSRDSLTFFSDFAPVQTTFPELNINADVFGSFIRITKPGNCSGLYSVFGRVSASFIKGMSCFKSVVATIFWILISVLCLFIFYPLIYKY